MKKFTKYIFLILIILTIFNPISVSAQTDAATKTNTQYNLIQPLPCKGVNIEGCEGGKLISFYPSGASKLSEYLNLMITLFIGLCAVLAVVMIVIGGIEYSTSELISGKEAGKERITEALLGLFLALGAFTLLYTINPDLLKVDVKIGGVKLDVNIKEFIIENIIQVGETPVGNKAKNRGTPCDANVVFNASQEAGNNISKGEAAALSCIGGKESRGCQAIPADAQVGVKGGGFGQFQIVLSIHGNQFNNSVCKQVAEVDINQSLICKDRSSAACQKATSDLRCQAAVTAKIFLDSKKKEDYYGDWFRTQGPCANAQCVHELDPSVNLHIKVPAVPGRPNAINDLATYCNLR